MNFIVNGEKRWIEGQSPTLLDVLMSHKVGSPDMVAVQVNGGFVDKSLFQTTIITEGDEVEYLYFLGGGAGVAPPNAREIFQTNHIQHGGRR